MSLEFGGILQRLMDNRGLTAKTVTMASGRARATINQLLDSSLPPTVEILQDIAPVLQMPLGDLLAIADLSTEPAPDRSGPWKATSEIGSLVAAATWLTPEQVSQLADLANDLKARNLGERT
jgi:transcriptional regulator with XRE-family HTH domain